MFLFRGLQENDYYTVRDSNGRQVPLFLPKHQWDYLRWLPTQKFDTDRFIYLCDTRRRGIVGKQIPLSDFVSFATEMLFRMHYAPYEERTNLTQPVLPGQMIAALTKAEKFFRNSGSNYRQLDPIKA